MEAKPGVWQSTLPYQSCNSRKILLINSLKAFIVGTDEYILRTTDGGGQINVSIRKQSEKISTHFSLSQNYPNPFNPSTKIKFDIAPSPTSGEGRGEVVKLIIYDILGREVATLVNEELKPGSYEYEWNGSNFASGIYIYKLETSYFSNAKKMVLIK